MRWYPWDAFVVEPEVDALAAVPDPALATGLAAASTRASAATTDIEVLPIEVRRISRLLDERAAALRVHEEPGAGMPSIGLERIVRGGQRPL
jgi:hypothetical protein